MGKSYIAIATGAALLAFATSAEAGGRSSAPGPTFAPPGLTHLPSAATGHANFGTTTTTPSFSSPPSWSQNTTGQTQGWNSSLVPPGLNNPPGR